MLNKCYADTMGMHPCDYGCVCDKCLYNDIELVGGNNMKKYLVMYTYYDGEMTALYSVDNTSDFQPYESVEKAVEEAIDYLIEYISEEGEIQDVDGNWLYYVDENGRERAIQIRVYDEDMEEIDIRW